LGLFQIGFNLARILRVWTLPKSSFTKEYRSLRNFLISARQAAGLTQSQLSKTLSRPQSYVSKYERGERRLDLIEFLEVAKALGADPHALIKSIRGMHKGKQPSQ
jgi:ribosome-binding protein aMBF1 (putative translation factor)